MKKIYVKDYSGETTSNSAGDKLYMALLAYERSSEVIDVSFSGLMCPTSSFLNSSLVRLIEGEKRALWAGRLRISGLNTRNAEFIKQYLAHF